jgi:hypothetical protein
MKISGGTGRICATLVALVLSGESSANLDSVRNLKLTGFEKEPEAVQKHLIQQAELYEDFRWGRKKDAYYEHCKSAPTEMPNPFCRLEEERLQFSISRKLARIANRPPKRDVLILKAVRNLDEDKLKSATFREVKLAVSQLKNFTEIEKLADRVVKSESCALGGVAYGLAMKSEEKLPAAPWGDRTRELYKRAALCLSGDEGGLARFRAGLFMVWQQGCKGVVEWLEPIVSENQVGDSMAVRTRYWQHYCAAKTGDKTIVKAKREELKTRHPMTFHNLLVNRESPLKVERRPATLEAQLRSKLKPEANLLAQAVEAMLEIEAPAVWIGELVESQMVLLDQTEPEFQLYIGALLERAQQGLVKFKVLGQLLANHPEMVGESSLKMYFPIWYIDKVQRLSPPLDPMLVLALIRQESAFNPKAMSVVGARGLMQVMPYTARAFGVRRKEKLTDPETSIRVGSRILQKTLQRFDSDVEITLASYNAGPSRVVEWIKRYPVDHRMLFLDLMPYKETREYVTLIMRNYLWYTKLYSGRELYKGESRVVASSAHGTPTMDLKFATLSQEETLSAR